MPKLISRPELQHRLASTTPPTLVEALPEMYYRDGHLPGARHLPHTDVATLADRVLPDKSAPIVVYCASATCQNSHIAAEKLATLGYRSVFVYAGGKADWKDAGFPLEVAS